MSACAVDPSATPDAAGTGAAPRSPSATPPPRASGQASASPGGAHTPGTGGVATGAPTTASYDDDGPLGSMARTFLRATPARRLVVEVDYVAGRRPSSSALGHLRSILTSVVDKPGGVSVALGQEIPATGGPSTLEDIRRIERRERGRRSTGDTATMWIAFLDGRYAVDGNALGVAYSATAAAIFRDRIDDATTAVLVASSIERSVLVHEAGHLLALVNIGYRSKIAHEDPEHRYHSNNPNSVMYWAVEDMSIRTLLGGGPPDDFDANDRADLAMLREGG